MQIVSPSAPAIFFALGDLTRLRIVRLLAASGGEACLCELSATLGEPDYKLSRHLKLLRQVGLLSGVKEGRWVYHRVATGTPGLEDLTRAVLAFGDPTGAFSRDLASFADIKKGARGRCRGEVADDEKPTSEVGAL